MNFRKKTNKSRSDTAVQGTNDCSIASKWSMCDRGYFRDPFIKNFVNGKSRRAPLINRGYYIRAAAVNHVLVRFIGRSKAETQQIVSLGAGFDSTYFRLKDQDLLHNVIYIEVDFVELLRRKLQCIESSVDLSSLLGSRIPTNTNDSQNIVLNCNDYKLLGVDLSRTEWLTSTFKLVEVDFTRPTLILSEAVMTYLDPDCSSELIRWSAREFRNAMFVTYEQIQPSDAFGLFMCDHFRKLGSPLRGIDAFPTLKCQVQRYCDRGWQRTVACDMNYFYHHLISVDERRRVEALEPFDEFEEFHLKCLHYFILTAFNYIVETDEDVVTNDSLVHSCAEKIWQCSDIGEYSRIDSCQILSREEKLILSQYYRNGNLIDCKRSDSMISLTSSLSLSQSATAGNVKLRGHKAGEVPMKPLIATLHVVQSRDQLAADYWCSCTGHTSSRVVVPALDQNTAKGNIALVILGGFGLSRHSGHERRKHIIVKNMLDVFNESAIRRETSASADKESVSNDVICERDICDQNGVNNHENDGKMMDVDDGQVFERMFHTATVVDAHLIVVFGGRTSPLQAFNDVMLLEFTASLRNVSRISVTQRTVDITGEKPMARWKHTATFISSSANSLTLSNVLVVFGGRGVQQHCLSDCWALDCQQMIWTQISTSQSPVDCCEARHSHTADFWQDNNLIIACGIGEDSQPLSSIYILNLGLLVWKKFIPMCDIEPRYSHTSAVSGDNLMLVGGISFSSHSPAVTIIDLSTGLVHNVDIVNSSAERIIMLHNHSSILLTDDSNDCDLGTRSRNDIKLAIIGGGGNCFSFGTHLNARLMILNIPVSSLDSGQS